MELELKKLIRRDDGATATVFNHVFTHELLHAGSVRAIEGKALSYIVDHNYRMKEEDGISMISVYSMLLTQLKGSTVNKGIVREGEKVAYGQFGALAQNADTGAFILGLFRWLNADPNSLEGMALQSALGISREAPIGNRAELGKYLKERSEESLCVVLCPPKLN